MPEIMYKKINKMPEQILHDICPESARILRYVCPKNIFRDFWGVVGDGNPIAPPSPMPMAGPQAPHQLNPALVRDRLITHVTTKIPVDECDAIL